MNKVKATNITKYGVEYPMENSNICSKMQQTFIDKYGVSSPAQIKEIKDSIKINNLQKYGVENIKKKAIATLELKYGVDNPSKSKVILEKSYKTKRENHSFNISKPENDLYRKPVALFGQENIIRQYNTKIYENSDRYSFDCDFYIKPFDIFIELNLNWTHNDHRFNKDNEKDIAIFNYWKAKHLKFYDKAIEVWTIRDVLKFETAEKK